MWASLILGLAQMGYGAYQKGQAKKAYNSISDAPYNISQLYYDNVGLSENQAQTGWSAESSNYFSQQSQAALASQSNALLQGGGGVNDFNSLYSNFAAQNKTFSLEGDKMKMLKVTQLISDRSALAREQTQQWAINKYKKMQDQKAAAALMLSGANGMINSGLNTSIQGAAQIGKYYIADKEPTGEKNSVNADEPIPDIEKVFEDKWK